MTIAVLLLILGVGLTYAGYKIIDNRKKYEFTNRTDGGVVKFKNWQATKTHTIIIKLGKLVGVIGVLTFFIGVYMLVIN